MLKGELDEENMSIIVNNISNAEAEMFTYVKDKGLQDLITAFFNRYGVQFGRSVASSRYHHNYEGGLLIHTMEVVQTAVTIAKQYGYIEFDVIATGALFHDIGKMYCYEDAPDLKSGKRPKWEYQTSDESKDMGHFGEAIDIITSLLKDYSDINITREQEREIKHIIASHHGEPRFGWGSMVAPNTESAWIVFLADMASSRLGG